MGCKFPEALPDWQNIQNYRFKQLVFGKTSIKDFQQVCSGLQGKADNGDVYILACKPEQNNLYSNIRVGFLNEKLDWVEFTLKNNPEINEIVYLYGPPESINTTYSNTYDYYDYKFFNVSTDKEHKKAYHISIFGFPDNSVLATDIDQAIPGLYGYKTLKVLKPGITIEKEFNNEFPGLVPYKKNKFDTDSVYTISEFTKNKDLYSKVVLNFKNGILSSIYLTPKKLTFDKVKSIYGNDYRVEQIDGNLVLYDYTTFLVIAGKQDNRVKSIAIISSF